MTCTFLIPSYNQLFYLKNLINWIEWYHPDREQYPIVILDNNSNYQPLLNYYFEELNGKVEICMEEKNDCAGNLRKYIDERLKTEWYVIVDPDILPTPNTPYNYLDYFMRAVESGFHHAGFDLVTEDLPSWLEKRDSIIYDENLCRVEKLYFEGIECYRGAIDTTFALFKKSNGGWYAPMSGKDWSNGLRMFKAFHYKWYIDPQKINPELDNYFRTATFRDFTSGISAGKNYFRPSSYEK